METTSAAARVAREIYGLDAPFEIERLPQGRVNLTYLVETAGRKYILQRLHPVFGPDGAAASNAAAVGAALAGSEVIAPRVLPTLSGGLWAEDDGVWRLSTWLPGATRTRRSPSAGAECAGLLGVFHRILRENPPMLRPLPPAGHGREKPYPVEAWEALTNRYAGTSRMDRAADVLARGRDLAARLPNPDMASRGIVHGDPKLENFLFDDRGRAAGIIDLDTVRDGAYLWELADGLRSWAGDRDEADTVRLDRETMRFSVMAYREHGPALSPNEWERLPAVVAAVSLNLAFRYLSDYFEESYFRWDEARYASLAEQNLSRGAGLLEPVARLLDRGRGWMAPARGG